jgi:hypothetical protein
MRPQRRSVRARPTFATYVVRGRSIMSVMRAANREVWGCAPSRHRHDKNAPRPAEGNLLSEARKGIEVVLTRIWQALADSAAATTAPIQRRNPLVPGRHYTCPLSAAMPVRGSAASPWPASRSLSSATDPDPGTKWSLLRRISPCSLACCLGLLAPEGLKQVRSAVWVAWRQGV